MTIRRTTAAIVIAVAFGLVLTTEVLSRTVIRDGFDDLETAAAETDLERAQHAIDREVERLERSVLDWAEWDDTYAYIETRDPAYITSNVDVATLEALELSLFAIIGADGSPILVRSEDRETGAPLPFPSELVGYLQIPSSEEELGEYTSSGVLGLSAAPLAYAAHPVFTSLGDGPAPAVLVMGRYIDDTAIQRLSETTLLDLAVSAGSSDREVIELSDSRLLAREGIPVSGGDAGYTLEVELPRDIASRGRATTTALVIGVGAAGFGFAVVTFLLLEVLVLRRLGRLGHAMGRLGQKGDLTARLDSSGTDEIARLAGDINAMLTALERSEEQFRRVVESASDGIVLVREGRVTFANAAARAFFGWEQEPGPGGMALDLALPAELAAEARQIAEDARPGGGSRIQSAIRASDGARRLAEVSIGSVTTRQGPAVHLLVRDITERARAEEQRLALERKMSDAQRLESIGLLAGGVAHDFNNLLMAIAGNASLARLSTNGHAEAEEALGEIEAATARAADLTRQLLAYAGRGRLVVSTFDLSALASETARLVRRIGGRETPVHMELAEHLPHVEGDETQVRQVVMNLLTNAIDATAGRPGAVTIRTGVSELSEEQVAELPFESDAVPGPYVTLDVIDEGEGMVASALAQIFEPFFSTKGPGRGLGLAAVRGILRAHGGAITVTSEPGTGTHFRVVLPAATPVERSTELPVEVVSPAHGRALAVDDEEAVLGVASRMLARLGYDVEHATDGDEACVTVQGGEFDVVLLDVAMPRMNGVDAFRQIRATYPSLPVVLMSGYTFQELPPDVAGDPHLTFVQKPFTFVSLAAAIHAVSAAPSDA